MTQLTVRGFDDDLHRVLKELARRKGISLNRAALLLMRRGSGVDGSGDQPANVVGRSLDHLIGTWTAAEESDFLAAIRSCEQVDEEFWQ